MIHSSIPAAGATPRKLLNVTPNEPQTYDLSQNYQLDSPNEFKNLKNLSKTDNVTTSVTNTPATNVLSQENQRYYNRKDQQHIACTYDGGLE